ncbi:MAG: flagellar biosynthesis anti-sigma factor FlgM [Spirochaetota bacterium]|nr:flagellar biosynthesis anti-sigma factor FlgM [Spirochaetota bacterium]
MDIKKIGLIERIFKPIKNQLIKQTLTVQKSDEVTISSSVLRKSREGVSDDRIREIVMKTPDVRIDRINEVKAKFLNDDYIKNINNEVLAERILKSPFNYRIRSF